MPTSFASEDEERDWWAEHEFSEALYDEMMPTFEDVKEYWPMEIHAANLAEVEGLLAISRRHLDNLKRSERAAKDVKKVRQDAIASITFAAAAVETGLNLYLVAPLLFLEDEGQRAFFSKLLDRQICQMPVAEKLALAEELNPELRQCSDNETVRQLLHERDALTLRTQPNGTVSERWADKSTNFTWQVARIYLTAATDLLYLLWLTPSGKPATSVRKASSKRT